MPSSTATIVFIVGIVGLFALDRDPRSKTSKALWLPVLWLLIAASRPLSLWLQVAPLSESPDQFLEGNPLNQLVLSGLLAASLIVLVQRRQQVGTLLRANIPILLFFLYCAISTLWSDYPDVALKRWIRAIGDLAMVAIVLTEHDMKSAIGRLLARAGFLLVPVSILFIKYYPALGRGYHPWEWTPYYVGVTTNKNELGFLCLICGIGSVWRLLLTVQSKECTHRTGSLVAQGTLLAMTLWLFWMANSMTSLSCFLMACSLMVAITLPLLGRKVVIVHILVATALFVSFAALFLDLGSDMVTMMDRDPTLTGRTELWSQVISMTPSPFFGAGFESFWLGPRLEKIWSIYWWHPRQAHNGYIDIFLNLGWTGVILLFVVIVAGYRNAILALRRNPDLGTLSLAFFVVAVAYNFTESAIRMMSPVWICFLLATIAAPGVWASSRTRAAALRQLSREQAPCLEEA